MINQRVLRGPLNQHSDFTMYAIGGYADKSLINIEDYTFAFCWWGAAGKVADISSDVSDKVTWGLIRANEDYVREIFENIEWDKYSNGGLGAPRLQPYHVCTAYERYKKVKLSLIKGKKV